MTAELKRSSVGQTLILTISNPSYRNALGPEIYTAGIEALSLAEHSADVRTVLIAGEGAVFSAGGDLQRLQANRQQSASHQAKSIDALHSWIDAIRTFPKPVIAAVEGAAAGAGFSLALACDFIVAAENSVFIMAYSNIALSPDGGASWSLARALPRQLVTELLMCGERVSGRQLHNFGLVNKITAPSEAMVSALALAERLNQRAPNALQSIMTLINEADGATLAAQLTRERDHFVSNLHHTNAGIGIDAFLNKTKPNFS